MTEEIESKYKQLFAKLKTRKKFSIQKIEGNVITIEQDEEICGEKEPKIFIFETAKELEKFMEEENQFERAIVQQLSGNEMPFR